MEEERLNDEMVNITVDKNKQLDRNETNRKNYGHVVFSKIYHELEIDRFLKNARRHENFKFNTDAIMRLLVYTRLLFPGSKRASYLKKNAFLITLDSLSMISTLPLPILIRFAKHYCCIFMKRLKSNMTGQLTWFTMM